MGRPRPPRGLILDGGALIAFEQGKPKIRALVQRTQVLGSEMIVPAGVLAQAWRDGRRQARLAALLSARNMRVVDLTAMLAKAAGELCGRRGTDDIVDASVVLTARLTGAVVVTSDPKDLHHLDPALDIVCV